MKSLLKNAVGFSNTCLTVPGTAHLEVVGRFAIRSVAIENKY